MGNSISNWKRRYRIAQRLLAKSIFRLLGPANKFLLRRQQFCIKKGYHHAGSVIDFDDTSNTDEWQKEVYQLAKKIAGEKNYLSVIDLGCGSAYKLLHYLGDYETTGIEVGETLRWLKKNHPQRKWLSFEATNPSTLHCDLLICSDVIEHVKNPDELLAFIHAINCKEIIISTPEREAVAGKNDYGPPENPSHFREWNTREFKKYISTRFVLEEHCIFNDKSVTQVISCKK